MDVQYTPFWQISFFVPKNFLWSLVIGSRIFDLINGFLVKTIDKKSPRANKGHRKF